MNSDTATRTRALWSYELDTRGFRLPLQQRFFCFYRWMVEHNKLGHGRQDGRRS